MMARASATLGQRRRPAFGFEPGNATGGVGAGTSSRDCVPANGTLRASTGVARAVLPVSSSISASTLEYGNEISDQRIATQNNHSTTLPAVLDWFRPAGHNRGRGESKLRETSSPLLAITAALDRSCRSSRL